MKIQIITHDVFDFRSNFRDAKSLTISRFDDVDTFDSYEINVIDLSSDSIWKSNGSSADVSNEANNIKSIRKMIGSSKKTRFVFLLPSNIQFEYNKSYGEYKSKIKMRDNIKGMKAILLSIIDFTFGLEYMPNKTIVGDYLALSDFYFTDLPEGSINVLRSQDSEKIVSFEKNGNVYTTLSICTPELLFPLIEYYSNKKKQECPKWFEKICFNGDDKARKMIETKTKEIENAQQIIAEQKEILNNNNYYKSILFETGDTLVKIVFDIIKDITGLDLSTFVDKKKEDFNCLLDDTYYVGEIKGVSDNVKRKYLSELEDNKQDFLDRNNVSFAKGLLIINHQRGKAPEDREEVYPDQIAYAKKDELLIIESTTLLDIYESFLKGELDIEKFKRAIKDITGLLKDEWR